MDAATCKDGSDPRQYLGRYLETMIDCLDSAPVYTGPNAPILEAVSVFRGALVEALASHKASRSVA
jgi:hypothetical protein